MGIVSSALLHTDHSLVQHHLVAFHACPRKAVVTIDTLRHGHEQASDRKGLFWESIFVSLAGGISGIATGIILVFLQERFGLIKIAGGGAITAYPVALEVERRGNHSHPGGCHRCCHCCHHRHLRPLAHKLTRQSINPSIHQPVNPPNTFSKMSAQRYFF